eukprot:403372968
MEEQTNFDKSSQQIDSGKPSEVKVPRTHSQFAALISNQIPVTQFDELITLESIQFYISKISDNPDSILFNKKPRVLDYSLVGKFSISIITVINSQHSRTKSSEAERLSSKEVPDDYFAKLNSEKYQTKQILVKYCHKEVSNHGLITHPRILEKKFQSRNCSVNLHNLAAQHKANQKQVQQTKSDSDNFQEIMTNIWDSVLAQLYFDVQGQKYRSSTVFFNNLSKMTCQNLFNAHYESGVSVIQDDLAFCQKQQIMTLLKDFKKNEDMVNSKFLIKNDEQIRFQATLA